MRREGARIQCKKRKGGNRVQRSEVREEDSISNVQQGTFLEAEIAGAGRVD
jgi:hypothetical protein